MAKPLRVVDQAKVNTNLCSHSWVQRFCGSSTKLDSVALLKSQRVTIPIEMILLWKVLVKISVKYWMRNRNVIQKSNLETSSTADRFQTKFGLLLLIDSVG